MLRAILTRIPARFSKVRLFELGSELHINFPKITPAFQSCELGLNHRPKELQPFAPTTELSQVRV